MPTRLRRTRHALASCALRVHRNPSLVVTMANAPCEQDGMGKDMPPICASDKAKYFYFWGLTSFLQIRSYLPVGPDVVACTSDEPTGRECTPDDRLRDIRGFSRTTPDLASLIRATLARPMQLTVNSAKPRLLDQSDRDHRTSLAFLALLTSLDGLRPEAEMGAFSKIFWVLMASCWLGFSPALAEKRVALVIGNSAYLKVAKLSNPTKDSAAVAAM